MVELLERLDCNRHDLGLKPTRANLLCPCLGKDTLRVRFSAWWSYMALIRCDGRTNPPKIYQKVPHPYTRNCSIFS